METLRGALSALLSQNGISYTVEGNGKNLFIVSTGRDFFKAGNLLFEAGFLLEKPLRHAKRLGISKQAVNHFLYRDGKRVALVYGDMRGEMFIVDRVEENLIDC